MNAERPFFSDTIAPGYRWSTVYNRYVRADSDHFEPETDEELTDGERWENELESRAEDRAYHA